MNLRVAAPPANVTAVLARMPETVIAALVEILAGHHRTDSATHNAQCCADVVGPLAGLTGAELVYHWALEVEADLGRFGAGECAHTVYTEMLWDYSINVATLDRTAGFVLELAQGLSRKDG